MTESRLKYTKRIGDAPSKISAKYEAGKDRGSIIKKRKPIDLIGSNETVLGQLKHWGVNVLAGLFILTGCVTVGIETIFGSLFFMIGLILLPKVRRDIKTVIRRFLSSE